MQGLPAIKPQPQKLPGPLDLPTSLERFRRWGDDLIDRWDGRIWRRARPIPFAAEVVGRDTVELVDGEPIDLAEMIVQEPLAALARRDPVIARVNRAHPGLRPILERDPFTAIVRAISAQQVNLKWACTTRRRLVTTFGRRLDLAGDEVWALDAGRLATTDPAEIRALQFTTRKAEFIVAAARAAANGDLALDSFNGQSDDEVIDRLIKLPGVGRWTAEWFLARTLGRPVVAAGDLGVRKAVGIAYFEGRMPSEAEVRAATAHWGKAAGVAQQLLLHGLGEGTL